METKSFSESLSPYQADGGKAYHEAIHGGLGRHGYSLVATRRAAKIQPYVRDTDQVLEYGVGPGWNLAKIKAGRRKGYDVAAATRSWVEDQGLEFAEEIIPGDFAAYDVVICSHVLEHMLKPTEALETIWNCLKPNGKALLYVPFDYERKFRKYDVDEPNHHLYSWNVQSFSNLVILHGFTILECKLRLFGYERIVAIWVEKLKLPGWMYTLLLRVALFLMPGYEVELIVAKSNSKEN